jgi:hypothetical protein
MPLSYAKCHEELHFAYQTFMTSKLVLLGTLKLRLENVETLSIAVSTKQEHFACRSCSRKYNVAKVLNDFFLFKVAENAVNLFMTTCTCPCFDLKVP